MMKDGHSGKLSSYFIKKEKERLREKGESERQTDRQTKDKEREREYFSNFFIMLQL